MRNIYRPCIEYDPEDRPVYRSFFNYMDSDPANSYSAQNQSKMPNSALGQEEDLMEKIYKCKDKMMSRIKSSNELDF